MVDAPLYLDYYEKLLRLDRKGAVVLVKGYLADAATWKGSTSTC